jgi:hypothetical protein
MQNPFPHVCAWCGSPNPTMTHPVKSQEQKVTGFYLVAYTTSTTTYKMSLPVCEECETQLRKSRTKFILSCIIGGISGAIIGPGITTMLLGLDTFLCSMNLVLGATGGIILGMVFGKLVFKEKPWGAIIDGYYQFANETFRNAFIAHRQKLASENEQPEKPKLQL